MNDNCPIPIWEKYLQVHNHDMLALFNLPKAYCPPARKEQDCILPVSIHIANNLQGVLPSTRMDFVNVTGDLHLQHSPPCIKCFKADLYALRAPLQIFISMHSLRF